MEKRKLVQRLLSAVLMLALAVSILAMTALADTEGDWEYSVENGEATITAYTGSGGDIVIPSALGGYPVTSLASHLFSSRSELKSVVIPDSVTYIGAWAFSKCSALTSVTFGSGVTSIGNYAFDGCSKLSSITIPSGGKSIRECTFANCSSLASVTIPDGVTTIGNGAFYKCSSLRSIVIPDSVTLLDKQAFYCCSALTSAVIGSGVTSIGETAFYSCESLESIVIPDSVTEIGSSAFFQCSGMAQITVSNNLTEIPAKAFYGCSSLTSVTIPSGVETIGRSAFCYCSSLTSAAIPNSVTLISDYAFSDCESLADVWYGGTSAQWNDIEVGGNNDPLKNAECHTVVSALSIRYASKTIKVSETFQFTATGGSGSYAWRTGNASVATVDATGKVTGKAAGNTSLYCKDSTGKEVECLLEIVSPLSITAQPQNATLAAGGTAKFSIKADGSDLTYQWEYSTDGGKTWANSPATGNDTATLTIPATASCNGNRYRCVVKSGGESVISNTATLTIKAATADYPVLTGATASAGQITVKWSAVSDASKYAVYRKVSGGSWERLTNTATGTSYTDKSAKAGTTYWYTVRAYVGSAWGSYDATGVSVKAE